MDIKKRHLMWFAELLIWLLIFTLIAAGVFFLRFRQQQRYNSYQIFLPDVDGVIVGTPVRFLGITVGHISQIHIIKDEVFVSFIITDKNLKLPRGTVATVEFTGLGGSKSLELSPPDKVPTENEKFIISQEPKRIHDAFGILYDMMNEISLIVYRVSYFAKNTGMIKNQAIDLPKINPQQMIQNTDEWLERAGGYQKNIHVRLKELEK